MKAGNASIMAAAAVVVALCLLFSGVYLDDGTVAYLFYADFVDKA